MQIRYHWKKYYFKSWNHFTSTNLFSKVPKPVEILYYYYTLSYTIIHISSNDIAGMIIFFKKCIITKKILFAEVRQKICSTQQGLGRALLQLSGLRCTKKNIIYGLWYLINKKLWFLTAQTKQIIETIYSDELTTETFLHWLRVLKCTRYERRSSLQKKNYRKNNLFKHQLRI